MGYRCGAGDRRHHRDPQEIDHLRHRSHHRWVPRGARWGKHLQVSEPARVFEPTPNGLAERLGGHLRTHRPVVAGGAVVIAGYAVMAAVAIGLGLVITKWLAAGPVGTWEDSVNRWFVVQRTTTLNSVSSVGSDLGATLTVIG